MEEEKKDLESNMEENITSEVEESVVPQTMTNKKNDMAGSPKKGKGGLIAFIVIFIILIVAGIYIYAMFFNRNDETKGNDNPQVTPSPTDVLSTPVPSDNQEATEDAGNQGDYELTVYKYKDGGYLSNSNKKEDDLYFT